MSPGTIRGVVVDHNGGPRTLAALESLLSCDAPDGHDLDIVLVDNASHDDTAARAAAGLPRVRVLRNDANLGFAGGVNTALRDLDGVDHVALLNNDAVVARDWLAPLLATLDADPTVGAACPKILLAGQHLDVDVTAPARPRGALDPRPLGVRVSAVRVGDDDVWTRTRFVEGFFGPEAGPPPESAYQWSGPEARLRVPVGSDGPLPPCELRLAADAPATVTLRSGAATKVHDVGTEPAWYPAPLDGEPFDVVNNVGTTLGADAYGVDRGWLEIDDGSHDEPVDVFAWCGAAVLLRADYLRDVGLLDERLFLYSEDLELSWRARARGWRHRSAPASVVHHEHAATSGEHSTTKTYLDERNHLLVVARHGSGRLVTRTVARHLLVTASYAGRDVVSPLLDQRRVETSAVGLRLRALGGSLRLLPGVLADRRRDRARVRAR